MSTRGFEKNGDVISFQYQKYPGLKSAPVVYVWDLDKTYLDTQFETLKGLFRAAFEKAFQKRNVPGTASLVRTLTAAPVKKDAPPIFFISASPPQMEPKIAQKLSLDGIFPGLIFFKDNLKNFRPKKFKRLKEQVGFKVQALLQLRLLLGENVKMILFGDDSESDAVVYSLFSDICCRRLPTAEVLSLLEALHVLRDQRMRILALQKQIPPNDPVEKIFINLATDTDPDYYAKFGRRVLATFTTFQATLALYQDGRISDQALVMVATDMTSNYGFTPEELAKNLEDLQDRGFLNQEFATQAADLLKAAGLLPSSFAVRFKPVETLQKIGEKILGLQLDDPWVPDHIDYLNDFR